MIDLKGTMVMTTTSNVEFRKITDASESRMRARTAREQLAAALAEANREQDEVIPDSDDSSMQGYWPGSEQCFR